jgi:hypothetical protein
MNNATALNCPTTCLTAVNHPQTPAIHVQVDPKTNNTLVTQQVCILKYTLAIVLFSDTQSSQNLPRVTPCGGSILPSSLVKPLMKVLFDILEFMLVAYKAIK